METLSSGMSLIGLILSVIGSIWFFIVCFRESIWWGLGCLFFPFMELIFIIGHWHEAKKPVLFQVVGVGLIIAAPFVPEPDQPLSQGLRTAPQEATAQVGIVEGPNRQ
jgi:hypothetical protein